MANSINLGHLATAYFAARRYGDAVIHAQKIHRAAIRQSAASRHSRGEPSAPRPHSRSE